MSKKKFVVLLIFVVFIPFYILLGSQLYGWGYSNIFEEMYHDEYKYSTGLFERPSSLRRIQGMKQHKNYQLDGYFNVISEEYVDEFLPSDVAGISLSFFYPDKKLTNGEMSINIRYQIEPDVFLSVDYEPDFLTNKLSQRLFAFDKTHLSGEEELKAFIKKYKIDIDYFYDKSDQVVSSKLIPDWRRVYPSHFSSDNWGTVEVIRETYE